jgi:diacylglycerol kinase (ATP)
VTTSLIAVLAWLAVTVVVVIVTTSSGRPPKDPLPPGGRHRREDRPSMEGTPPRKRAAVIVNPTKFDQPEQVRETVTHVCERNGWAPPLWIETTEDDPGTGQATRALEQGVDLVCPLGGDGTVRAVAAALVGHDVPMGLLPGGTGNLMARNLDLPVDSLEEALQVALTGRDKHVDVGTINVLVPGETQDAAKDYYFLVMAGIGFDADVMADIDEDLKAKMGWAAYVVSGLKNVNGSRFGVDLSFDGARVSTHRRVRSVLIGNCGKVQMGVELLPDAQLDDGQLDALLISPTGVVGWAGVIGSIATKNRIGHKRLESQSFQTLSVRLHHPEIVQLDGDPIGPATVVSVGVRPLSLVVRVG